MNGAVTPLTHEIKTGDRVEILTNKSSKPSRDWLKIVKTPSAKSKIRRYFAAATKDDDAAAGRDILAKDLRKRGYGISTPRSTRALNAVAEQFDTSSSRTCLPPSAPARLPRALWVTRSSKSWTPSPRSSSPRPRLLPRSSSSLPAVPTASRKSAGKSASNGIIVKGESSSGLLVRLAHCCNPVTGDDIVGFITRGRGVSVHRANCPNVKGLMEHPERMDRSGVGRRCRHPLPGRDRGRVPGPHGPAQGCYHCHWRARARNILSAATSTNREGIATLRFMVEISDASGLDPLLAFISSVDSVYDARRLMPGEGGAQLKRRV